jgi:hypothetical protein
LKSFRPVAFVAATLLSATIFAGTAGAQSGATPQPKAKVTAKQPSGPAAPLVSKAPEPTYDEGTAQRISNAMLS